MTAQKCILLADDNESMYFIFKKACEKKGISNPVQWVKSGDQVLQYLRQEASFSDPARAPEPGVILMDVRMPGTSTKEILESIRSSGEWKDIPVVLWSNYSREDIEESELLHADDFITKPAGFRELTELISRLTSKIKPA